jgi:hypothetical protein
VLGGWIKLCNGEPRNFYTVLVGRISHGTLDGWMGGVYKMRKVYKILVGKPEWEM